MPSFGERLKREREKRKISLDDIALSTKIGTRMLTALEEENFDQLPGGIFNKGFVRAYARHLGIDEEQAIADYLEAAGQTTPPPTTSQSDVRIVPVRETEPPETSKSLPWGTLAAVLLLLALALSVWSFLQREKIQENPPNSIHATAPVPARPTATASTATSQKQDAVVKSEKSPAAAPLSGTSEAVPSNAPQTSPSPSSMINLTIKAFDDCWVSITVDGKLITADGEIAGGTTKTIEANREIVIKAGNVGALDFSLNGKPLGRQGKEGEVKTLTFGPQGLTTPPAATENPTTAPTG